MDNHPNTIITDEGLEFYNRQTNEVFQKYGIRNLLTMELCITSLTPLDHQVIDIARTQNRNRSKWKAAYTDRFFIYETHYLDPTSYQGVKYVGQKYRKVYDYRNGGGLINIKAYLYKVKFADSTSVEFRLNPEFSLKESKLQAKKYGQALGRIPKIFRSRLDSFAIHKGELMVNY